MDEYSRLGLEGGGWEVQQHLLLSGHRVERHVVMQKTIACLLLTKGERMRKVFLYESGKREVSQWLILKLVDSPPLFILKTVLNDPF